MVGLQLNVDCGFADCTVGKMGLGYKVLSTSPSAF